MKIVLINPGTLPIYSQHEPLNLGFIAAYLEKNGVSVKIVDQLAGENVEQEIIKYKPDVAGITATTPVVPEAYKIADFCRRQKILTVIGGVHASVMPEEAIKHADVVVQGEGEIAMLDIAAGRIKQGIHRGDYIKNLDDVPLPARHLMKMDFYIETRKRIPYNVHLSSLPRNSRVGHLLTSRGCSHGGCIFCHNTWKNAPCRWDSAEKIISEITYMKKNYGIDAIYYMDDNFLADRDRTVKLCELIRRNKLENIVWGTATRVETVDKEILSVIKSAGCRLLNFGFESGSQRILDILNKGAKVEQAQDAVRMCREAGIIPHGTFIIGSPTETLEDIELTKRFIAKNDIASPLIGFLTPYPGTQYWNMLESKGLLPEKHEDIDWESLTQERVVINTSMIPTEKLRKMRTLMYLEYFMRHRGEAAKLMFNMISNPVASAIKIKNTIAPVVTPAMDSAIVRGLARLFARMLAPAVNLLKKVFGNDKEKRASR